MFNLFKTHHPVRHANSFKYAFSGIFHTIFNEANFRVQIAITIFAVILGIHFSITITEWAVMVLSLGMLLSAELLNTVIENFVDHLIEDHHEGVKVIKDVSAAYVLMTALTTLVILVIIFWERLFR